MVGGLNFLDWTLLSSFNSGLHYFVSCLLFVPWLFLVISTFFNQFVNTLIWYTVVASSRLAPCLVDRLVSCSLKPIEWSALDHSKLFFCWFPPTTKLLHPWGRRFKSLGDSQIWGVVFSKVTLSWLKFVQLWN